MLLTCFSTDRSETTRIPAIAPLDRPAAIRPSASRAVGVSAPSPSVRRLAPSSCVTTSGSRAVPPAATRLSASTSSPTSATRSLSRYPTPAAPAPDAAPSRSAAYRVSMYWENTSTPVLGVVTADGDRATQALIGVPARHPHIHYASPPPVPSHPSPH